MRAAPWGLAPGAPRRLWNTNPPRIPLSLFPPPLVLAPLRWCPPSLNNSAATQPAQP